MDTMYIHINILKTALAGQMSKMTEQMVFYTFYNLCFINYFVFYNWGRVVCLISRCKLLLLL